MSGFTIQTPQTSEGKIQNLKFQDIKSKHLQILEIICNLP